MKKVLLIFVLFSFISCVSAQQPARTLKEEPEKNLIEEKISTAAPEHETEVPEFVPVKEGASPLKTKTVSIAARNTPLRDVLYTIAETANLNLVLERYVNPDLPITMTFRDISVEDALNLIFDSVDYFYSVKDNILIVRAAGTEIFELGRPNVTQEYKIDVGGDILSGTSSGGEGESPVSGDVSIKSTSDAASFQFWDSLEKALATLLSTGGAAKGGGPQAKFVVNRMTGTIMVTAAKNDIKKVSDYLANLKKVLDRQVLIEARIVEVQLSEGLKYGIDWTAVGEWLGAGPMSISTNAFTEVLTSGGPSFEINIFDNDNLTLLLKALQEQGEVRTLSNPRVSIMNGQTSMLSVGRNTTFISRVETTTTTSDGSSPVTTFTVDTNSILSGIMFGLVPYINSDGEISLTITPIVTNLIDLEAKTIGTGDNSVEIKLPTVDLREMSTTVKVLDGQLVIIGGLIDKKEILREDKVPVLGDIPVVGKAFTSVDKSYENTELVIMLIPRIVS